ncbi:hypothetical protein AB0469_32030 [Streptomyces sp. NPDC093801]|uniref:hypothetical protein n=1 Tax=Streptomyces sp. NPDC093801 TaxID=3155203 RepID=UPI003450B1C7
MHDEPDPEPPRAPLSLTQRARADAASRALASSRIADLAALDGAASILMIERLRSALDDALRLLNEATQ